MRRNVGDGVVVVAGGSVFLGSSLCTTLSWAQMILNLQVPTIDMPDF